MARFSGTRNRDIFDGLLNEDNLFVFRPAYLSATDHVFGSTNLNVVDTLAFTTAARVQAGKFDDTRNIEVIRLDVAGIDLTVSQQLAGSSQRGFLTISGSEGADIVSGQPTDPARGPVTTPLVFNSGGGADRFTGGEGNDRVIFGDEDSTGIVLDGRGDFDTLVYNGTGTFDFASLASIINFEGVELRARDGSATLILDDRPFDTSATNVFTVRSYGSDTIDASRLGVGSDLIAYLNDGDDTVTSGSGADIIYGGAGNDVLNGGAGSSRLYGDDGDDTLISGNTNSDILEGGAGNDILFGGGGRGDILRGGTGINRLDGGAGIDDQGSLDFSDRTGVVRFEGASVAGVIYEVTVDGVFAGSMTNIERHIIAGGSGDDILTTLASASFSGRAGNDILTGSGLLNGGDGDDTLNGRSGFDDLFGGNGNDILNGGDGGDDLNGEDGDDILNGGNGDDDLDGGLGNNVIDGGAGNDEAVFDFSARTGNLRFEIGGVSGVIYQATVDGVFAGSAANIEDFKIIGGTGDDILTGGSNSDEFFGGSGNDTLSGGDGNDKLTGNDGDDILSGGDGNDDLDGGLGNAVIDGGAGTDLARFDFSDRSGNLRFDVGVAPDVAYEATIDGVFVGSATNVEVTVIRGGSGDDIVSVFTTGTSGRNGVIYGGDGNDILTGGGSAVYLSGDAGNDILNDSTGIDFSHGGDGDDILYAGQALDSLDGGAGNDILYIVTATKREFIGGLGDDTLSLNGAGLTIDLRETIDAILGEISGIERLDLTGSGNNSVTLNAAVLNSRVSNHDSAFTAAPIGAAWVVLGDSGDTLDLRAQNTIYGLNTIGAWSEVQSNVGLDGAAGGGFDFWAYVEGGQTTAFLAVDSDVTVLTPAFALADAPLGAEAFEAAGAGLGGGFDRLEGIPHLA